MELRITDPSEPGYSGYWTVRVHQDGDLLLEGNVATTVLEGAGPDDLGDLAEQLRELADVYEQFDEAEGVSL
jgi:hypothetical protein